MPPSLDIYVVSKSRDLKTINRFIDAYVDRTASEDRGDEELMMVPLGVPAPPSDWHDWTWEPAKSLTNVVARGLDHPRRAFAVYLKAMDASLEGAVLGFTIEDEVIFGVSLDDEGAKQENMQRAKALLDEMGWKLAGQRGYIGCEMAPPLFCRDASQHGPDIVWTSE